jgi:hypothetical protein
MNCYENPIFVACYEGIASGSGNDCYIPEHWAQESLEILFENMVVANLVHRDFEKEIANYGDTVHTRRPAESKIMFRTDATAVAGLNQATVSADVPVVLNQWQNQTFCIKPGEMSLSFKDLVQTYLAPRIKVMARAVDRAVLGRMAASFGLTGATRAGKLNGLTSATAYDAVVELDQILNQNKAPQDGRNLLLAPSAKAAMLKCDNFVKAMYRGDGSSPITTAQLGSVLNFDTYLSQNVNQVLIGADVVNFAIDAAPVAAETAVIPAAAVSTTATVGEYVTIVGDAQPGYIAAKSNSTSFTLAEGLKYPVLASAVATRYNKCAVAASAAAGYREGVSLKSHTSGKGPQVGQLLSFCDDTTGANRHTYTVIEVVVTATTTSTVLLDRPLDKAITQDSTVVCPGPYGAINPAFHRNCLALVTRPLAVQTGAGLLSAVHSADGIGISITMQDVINEGRKVAIDMLFGTAVLDANLCVPLLG